MKKIDLDGQIDVENSSIFSAKILFTKSLALFFFVDDQRWFSNTPLTDKDNVDLPSVREVSLVSRGWNGKFSSRVAFLWACQVTKFRCFVLVFVRPHPHLHPCPHPREKSVVVEEWRHSPVAILIGFFSPYLSMTLSYFRFNSFSLLPTYGLLFANVNKLG